MKIAAGIVLYNPDLTRLKANIDAIYTQVELVVLIDNNSSNLNDIKRAYKYYRNIVIIENKLNLGVAAALNQILSYGESRDCSWVLTLDQDSVCPSNLIEKYYEHIYRPKVAVISPVIIDINREYKNNNNKNDFEVVEKCITSAALTNVFVWRKLGGFDEKMFIDLVDFDFCKRIISMGHTIIKVNTVNLLHEIGNITQHKFLWFTINIKNHSHIRKYYMTRNILYLSKKHSTKGSMIEAYLRIIKLLILTAVYERDKKVKIKAIFNGIKSGRKLNKT